MEKQKVGLDGIPHKLYIASGGPGQLLLAQLLHRATLEGPPMAWRGGHMWAAPRKTLRPLSPLNSRARLCAVHTTNHFAATVRRALAPTPHSLVKAYQLGAVTGGGTQFPMYIARLLQNKAATKRISAALLFGGMRKAYYSAI